MKMIFEHSYVEKAIKSAHPLQKISKPKLFLNFILYQTTLCTSDQKMPTICKIGLRRFSSGVLPVVDEWDRAECLRLKGRTASLRILCNSFCSGKKQMKFAPLWGPVQTFVGLIVPNFNFKESRPSVQKIGENAFPGQKTSQKQSHRFQGLEAQKQDRRTHINRNIC